jgi:hypothetical protein
VAVENAFSILEIFIPELIDPLESSPPHLLVITSTLLSLLSLTGCGRLVWLAAGIIYYGYYCEFGFIKGFYMAVSEFFLLSSHFLSPGEHWILNWLELSRHAI